MTNDSGEQKIQSWEFSGSGIVSGPYTKGEFVRYEDHVKEVERLRADNAKLREAIKTATGYMFHACQPNQGDLFAEFDDKIKALMIADILIKNEMETRKPDKAKP